MFKRIFLVLIFFPVFAFGQVQINDIIKIKKLKGILYKNELSFEAKLHSFGFALGLNKGKIKTYYLTKYYHFDIGYLKSIKEKRNNLVSTSINFYNSYTFGKRNYFFPARLGLGIKKFLSEKEEVHGVAVGYSIEGGFTAGILKPYYLRVKIANDEGVYYKAIKYSEETKDLFTNENVIFDRTSFFKGFDELSMVPGIHLNAAIHYALKAYEKPVYAIETGVMIDAFIKRVPLMVETSEFKNKSLFINVYINVQLGNRWN
ncbi:MAG TPA: hypothetical protein ENK91_04345 [Bacteroidetes bacterium]|nr:hypothetical protein [Bacteroidota bacterium]